MSNTITNYQKLKSILNTLLPYLFIILIGIVVWLWFQTNQSLKEAKSNSIHLVEALNDSLTIYTNKHGQAVARIQTIQTESVKDFTNLTIKSNAEIQRLQALVKEYAKKMPAGSTATIIKTETKFDTVFADTPQIGKIIGKDTILNTVDNQWITSTYGWAKDSSVFKLKTRDEYDIVVGYDKKKPFADIISHSPYSAVQSMRSYQVKVPAQKKNHIGIQVTYGIGPNLKPQPIVGFGFTRSLFSF